MRKLIRLGKLAIILGLLALPIFADYLEVQRSATIKIEPNGAVPVIERAEPGTFLALLDDGAQTNGYYHVRSAIQIRNGWVYRTFVRRRPGDLPQQQQAAQPLNLLEDQTLNLTEDQKRVAARYLRLGKPQAVYERVREGYVLADDARLKIPLWVQYELTRADLLGTANRTDDFRPDTSIPYGARAELSDYRGSGLDRGHMAPAGDMKRSVNAISESFLLSNMSPQVGVGFNQQIWQDLESAVRGWVEQRGALTIIVGPVFNVRDGRVSYRVVGRNNVAVPTHFYKIVIDANNVNNIEALAFLIPNENLSGHNYAEYLVSIDEVESLTGLNFLSALPQAVQDSVESKRAEKIW
jgi:endonuclease G